MIKRSLNKILDCQHTYGKGEVQPFTNKIIMEINKDWDINAKTSDLEVVITSETIEINFHPISSQFFYFTPRQSLIDKFKKYPEALV